MAPALRTTDPSTRMHDRSDEAARLAAGLRIAVMRLARRLRQHSDSGITPSMLSVLTSLRHGPLTLGELAAVEGIQPPTLTPIVARLEATGLVVRETDPADRRISRAAVTPQGRRLLERVKSRKTAYLATRIRRMDPEGRAVLERATLLLERLAGEDP